MYCEAVSFPSSSIKDWYKKNITSPLHASLRAHDESFFRLRFQISIIISPPCDNKLYIMEEAVIQIRIIHYIDHFWWYLTFSLTFWSQNKSWMIDMYTCVGRGVGWYVGRWSDQATLRVKYHCSHFFGTILFKQKRNSTWITHIEMLMNAQFAMLGYMTNITK